MIQLLSTEVLDYVNLKSFHLDNYTDDGSIGCFLEIRLDYPNELHDLHNDYPLVAEKIKDTKEMLSEYQLQIIGYTFSLGKNKKLVPNLGNYKSKLLYWNLEPYLELRLQLKNNNKALEFKQATIWTPIMNC